MISGTITDASGRTLSGQTVEAFVLHYLIFLYLSIGFKLCTWSRFTFTVLEKIK